MTRAILATGLTFARRDAEAIREFTLAIPVLLGTTNEADDEDATVTVSADRRLQTVLEAYITLLARSNLPTRAEEGLRLSEAISRPLGAERACVVRGPRRRPYPANGRDRAQGAGSAQAGGGTGSPP